MKSTKINILQLVALTALFTAGFANASVTLTIGTAGWGNSTTTGVNGMTWGIIVNPSGALNNTTTVSTLQTALQGFTIPSSASPSTPVQIGTSGLYFAEAQSQTANGPPAAFPPGYMNTDNFNLTGVSAGNSFGVLWFPTNTTTVGSAFGYQIPTRTPTLPSDGSSISSGINTTPGLASYTIGAAPEPSRAILAALGLGFISLRRRRR